MPLPAVNEDARFNSVSEQLSRLLETTLDKYTTFDGRAPTLGEVKVAIARLIVRRSDSKPTLDKWLSDLALGVNAIFTQRKA